MGYEYYQTASRHGLRDCLARLSYLKLPFHRGSWFSRAHRCKTLPFNFPFRPTINFVPFTKKVITINKTDETRMKEKEREREITISLCGRSLCESKNAARKVVIVIPLEWECDLPSVAFNSRSSQDEGAYRRVHRRSPAKIAHRDGL